MKSNLILLLTVVFLAMAAHAAPMLVLEVTLTEKQAEGRTQVWKPEPVTVADRVPAFFHLGGYIVEITPALDARGQVVVPMVVPMVVTKGTGETAKLICRPTITLELGRAAEVATDSLQLNVVTTRAK